MIGSGTSLGPVGNAREDVTSQDGALPSAGSGFSAAAADVGTNFTYARLMVKITGSGTVTLTPYYYDATLGAYIAGSAIENVSGTAVVMIEVDGHDDVWIQLDNWSAGNSITDIDVRYRLLNRA